MMTIKERDVVLQGREGGEDTIDLPITRLGNVEDGAEIKQAPDDEDYIPVMDSSDGGQMKKTKAAGFQRKLTGAEGQVVGFDTEGHAIPQDALTMERVKEAIDAAISGTIEEAY